MDLIKSFGPPTTAVVLGAIIANFIIPYWQNRINKKRIFEEHRLSLLENATDQFVRYIVCWRRVIQLSQNEDSLSEIQIEMRNSYVRSRNEQRENLLSTLHKSQIYYGDDVFSVLMEFVSWDEDQTIKTLDELPDIHEWWIWQRRVISVMKEAS